MRFVIYTLAQFYKTNVRSAVSGLTPLLVTPPRLNAAKLLEAGSRGPILPLSYQEELQGEPRALRLILPQWHLEATDGVTSSVIERCATQLVFEGQKGVPVEKLSLADQQRRQQGEREPAAPRRPCPQGKARRGKRPAAAAAEGPRGGRYGPLQNQSPPKRYSGY